MSTCFISSYPSIDTYLIGCHFSANKADNKITGTHFIDIPLTGIDIHGSYDLAPPRTGSS